MTFANFPKPFSGGITIQGMPITMAFATGQRSLGNTALTGVWWVDSANGLDGNNQGTYVLPLKTLGRALALATANDIIMLKPGHAETISSATAASGAWNVAGVSIVGLGVGGQRPSFTLDTATTSTINVSAANMSVTNCQFIANFAAIVALFTITTAIGFSFYNNVVADTASNKNFLAIFVTDATANHADKLLVDSNKFYLLATSGVVQLYQPGAGADQVVINNNFWSTPTTNAAAAIALSTFAHTNFLVTNNIFNMTNIAATATAIIITGTGASTGFVYNNLAFSVANAGGTTNLLFTTGTGLRFHGNYTSDTADTSMYLLPVADS